MEIKTKNKKKWLGYVTEHSFVLDLHEGVFTLNDPRKIAISLKHSSEKSKRKKKNDFQSAMSMLNFYINRAGKNLPSRQKKILERAKTELRKLFNKKEAS